MGTEDYRSEHQGQHGFIRKDDVTREMTRLTTKYIRDKNKSDFHKDGFLKGFYHPPVDALKRVFEGGLVSFFGFFDEKHHQIAAIKRFFLTDPNHDGKDWAKLAESSGIYVLSLAFIGIVVMAAVHMKSWIASAKRYRKVVTRQISSASTLLDRDKWYQQAAEQGRADADDEHGSDADSASENLAAPIEQHRSTAEQGDAEAQWKLGNAYNFGEGVAKNFAEAVKWYRKAAELGHANAQYMLSVSYANGKGVVKNRLLAYQWALLSAANSSEEAVKLMSMLEKDLSGEQQAEGQRLATEWQTKFETN